MSRTLQAVTRAAERKDRACAEALEQYAAAMRQAREAGHTYRAIGEAAGISAQGALYIIQGNPRRNGKEKQPS